MKAIRVRALGGPDVLRLEDVPLPEPQAGQLRLRVAAAGLNFIEIYQRSGLYPVPLPWTPGGEGAGEVVAVGEGCTRFKPGDRVASVNLLGAYAEQALVHEDRAVAVPDGIEIRQAAGALLQGMTAHYLALTTRPLQSGDTCLVHAAAGGVGLLLVQIARRRGARVFGTVSTDEKARLAREAGADHVILYTREDFQAEVRRLTAGRGVQVVYDSVGQATFGKSLDCLAPLGMLVLYGQSSGVVPPVDPGLLAQKGSLFLTRPSLFHYVADRASLEARAADVFGWIRDGSLELRLDRSFPLAQAGDAQRALAARETTGKVLIVP
jgi:NADPH2:quinone reductase